MKARYTMLAGTLGAATLLAASVPAFAQQSQNANRPAPSTECIEAMAAKSDVFLADIDAKVAAKKSAMQTRKDALLAAAALTDDAARTDAVKKANEAFRNSMKSLRESQSTERKAAIEAVKAACGDRVKKPRKGGQAGQGKQGRGPRGQGQQESTITE